MIYMEKKRKKEKKIREKERTEVFMLLTNVRVAKGEQNGLV